MPTSARAGQTRSITVGVSDKRYPETVQVHLLKSNSQGGFDQVGTLTQSTPVTTGKSATSFAFSYTFTASDVADNTAIASTAIH